MHLAVISPVSKPAPVVLSAGAAAVAGLCLCLLAYFGQRCNIMVSSFNLSQTGSATEMFKEFYVIYG